MDIGVTIDIRPDEANAVDAAVADARAAAGAGLGSAWLAQLYNYDSVALAGVIGREVPDLRVGTSVVPVFGRHPLAVAAAAQTAQAATGGRFTLGLGLGSKPLVESSFGVKHRNTAEHLREYLTVLREFFATGTAAFDGDTLTARTPFPSGLGGGTPLEIAVAAMGPRTLAVANDLADAVLPFLAGPKALETVFRTAVPNTRIIALVPVLVTDEVDAAREALARSHSFYDAIPSYQRVIAASGAERAVDLAIVGTEEQVAAGLRDYFGAGADTVVATATRTNGPADQERTWRLLGELAREN